MSNAKAVDKPAACALPNNVNITWPITTATTINYNCSIALNEIVAPANRLEFEFTAKANANASLAMGACATAAGACGHALPCELSMQ